MEFVCIQSAGDGEGGVCWVTGEVDVSTADELAARAIDALDAYGPPLVIDFSGVTFLDCSGVRALLAIREHAAVDGGAPDVRLRGLARPVARVLRVTAMDALFSVAPAPWEATS
jgi:anti-anti-sigma factor